MVTKIGGSSNKYISEPFFHFISRLLIHPADSAPVGRSLEKAIRSSHTFRCDRNENSFEFFGKLSPAYAFPAPVPLGESLVLLLPLVSISLSALSACTVALQVSIRRTWSCLRARRFPPADARVTARPATSRSSAAPAASRGRASRRSYENSTLCWTTHTMLHFYSHTPSFCTSFFVCLFVSPPPPFTAILCLTINKKKQQQKNAALAGKKFSNVWEPVSVRGEFFLFIMDLFFLMHLHNSLFLLQTRYLKKKSTEMYNPRLH